MKAFRRELQWLICIRIQGGGWAPLICSNYLTRREAMADLACLIEANHYRRRELAVCRARVTVEQATAKQIGGGR